MPTFHDVALKSSTSLNCFSSSYAYMLVRKAVGSGESERKRERKAKFSKDFEGERFLYNIYFYIF